MNKHKFCNWVLRLAGLVAMICGAIQIITQQYIHPTSYGLVVLMLGVVAIIMSCDKKEKTNNG